MPSKRAKARKQKRLKLNKELARQGRTANQVRKNRAKAGSGSTLPGRR